MNIKLMGILIMLCSLFGCSSAQTQGFKSLTVEEYAKAIEDTGIVRLDVRTAEEYADGHIANTINIDVLKDDFEKKAKATLPKDKVIAVTAVAGSEARTQQESSLKTVSKS